MAFYGVNKDVMVRELNLKFKLFVQQKGGIGIRSLRHIFRRMDFNGNGKLDQGEFEQALAAFGYVYLNRRGHALTCYFYIDCSQRR